MAIGDRTYQWAAHTAWGKYDNLQQNVIEHTFGYTYHKKKVSAATTAAVLAATASVVAGVTVTAGITNPDVPRVLSATFGGTTNDFAASTLTINGYNVEGKAISDVLTVADNQTGVVTGTLVFKRVTSVVLGKADGTGGTFSIDTTNKIGLNHRLRPSFSTIVEVSEAQTSPYNSSAATSSGFVKPTVLAAPSSSNADGEFVEKNWVQSATNPDGTTSRVYYYWFHKVLLYPPKDSPEFESTTTSTSTSSTSSSTSTSSTSTSTSSTSVSTSSTSSSTSSTSTSTTTLPV